MLQKPVLIVGAGLGGLALAQTLRKHSVPFLVFERDEAEKSRPQGWSLGLSWIIEPLLASTIEGNRPPLESCATDASIGLNDFDGPDGSAIIDPKTGAVVMLNVHKFEGIEEIRVNRDNLRHWLLRDIDVQWGKRFLRYEETANGVTVHFADGTSVTGSVLVGADGVNSTLRAQLFSYSPEAAAATQPSCLPVTIWASSRNYPYSLYEQCRVLGSGPIGMMGHNYFFMLCLNLLKDPPQDGAEYLWFLSNVDQEELRKQTRGESKGVEWMDKQLRKSQEERLRECMDTIDGMLEPWKSLVSDTPNTGHDIVPLFMREVKIDSLPKGRVTLLGDAAHAMSIFNGTGGNHAMLDGLKLGALLAKAAGTDDDVIGILQEYQEEMLPRTMKEQESARASTFAVNKTDEERLAVGGVEGAFNEKRHLRAVPKGL